MIYLESLIGLDLVKSDQIRKSEVQKSIDPVRYKYREWQWGIVIDDDFYTDRCGYRKQDFIKGDFM